MLTLAFLASLAILVVTLPTVSAQQITAAITGTVVDPSGAPVNAAAVTATDTKRGTVWTTQTNTAGAYNLPRLPVGSYQVEATAAGFQTAKSAEVTLDLNQLANIDFKMKIGSKTETVEVTGAAPILQTQSTEIGNVIDSNTAVSVPLAARNYIQLTLLTPGATTPNPQTLYQAQSMPSSGRPYINGNREQANEFLLDGIINSENTNNEVGYQPSIDAIQEFNVITQNASAEFGNYQGGVINTSIKSGTNAFHGSIFEFLRNDVLNANSWSAGLAQGGTVIPGVTDANGIPLKATLRWNMFGGTIGGPIFKNKLFFFADYQGQRFDTPSSPASYQLFTPREVAGDFGQLCTDGKNGPNTGGTFVGGFCVGGTQLKNPATGANIPFNNLGAAGLAISPVAQGLFGLPAYTAAQQVMNNITNGTNFFAKSSSQLNNDQGDLKIDYNYSDRDRFFGRYSQGHISNPAINTFTLGDPGAQVEQPVRNAMVNWTHTFTPTLLNEFRIGFSAVDYNQTDFGSSKLGEQIGIAGANAFGNGLPLINLSDFTYGVNGLLQIFHTTTGQLADNVILTYGRHTIHTGVQYWRERLDYIYPGNNGVLGTINIDKASGSTQADFWLGRVIGGGRDAGTTQFGRRANVYAFFGQDDWRLTNTITLNLGLRFEDHVPFHEIENREINFGLIDGSLNQASGGNALYNNYTGIGDWQPRIGVAWAPSTLGGNTVIRAAYGISSYSEGGGANQLLTKNWPPAFQSSLLSPGNIANGFGAPVVACPEPFTLSCFVKKPIKVFNPDWRPATAQQWNLSIQHQFTSTLTAQLGYVGQHGTHLLNLMDYQQKQLVDGSGNIVRTGEVGTVIPSRFLDANSVLKSGYVGGTDSNASQRYDSLQAVLRKRMGNGLDGQVAYTYSKCLTNSAGYYGTSAWGGNGSQTSLGLPGWQNIYDGRSEWGPCFFDQTHLLSSYATYQLPFGRGKQFVHDANSVANALVGNWELSSIVSLHTGNAITPSLWFNDPSKTGGAGGLFASGRPNCSGGPSYPQKKVDVPGAGYIQWFDPSTFSEPADFTFGTCSNGVIRGPGFADVDMSILKGFPIGENKRIEFRSEFINLLNHPILNFGPALNGYQLGRNSFGQISNSQGERNIQFGLKFYY